MVIYSCKTCCKNFYKKSTYINHTVNKKFPCTPYNYTKPIQNICIENTISPISPIHKNPEFLQKDILNYKLEDIIINNINNNDNNDNNDNDDNIINNNIKITKHKCNFCKKYFCRNDVLKTHINKFCKVRKEENADKDKIIELLIKKDEQIEHLLGMISKLTENTNQALTNAHNITTESNNTNTNNGSIATNNGNITTNNIKIEFGKEDLKKITDDFFIKTLLNFSGAAIPSKIIEGIHFNPELKEFMNVFITDMSRNKAMIHDGNKWNIANADEIVDTLFDKAVNFCEDRNEELKDKIEKNNKINKKINKEMYIMDIMVNNEPHDYNEYEQPIDINGNILKKEELTRGKRLNTKAKEHLKKNLYNKKENIKKIK